LHTKCENATGQTNKIVLKLTFDTHGNEKQKECARYWADKETTDIVYGGSKGSAKSYTGCSLIFGTAFMYPETHWFIARKHLNDLRKFTIPSIMEVFGHWGLGNEYWNFNGQDNFFTLHNKSKVFLLDAKPIPSDPLYMRFGSMQNTGGWLEEAGEFEEEAKNNLFASIGRWKNDDYGLTGKGLQTCNPSKNYLYRDYYKPHKNGTLDPHKKFIQALPQDNKKQAAGYLEHLYRTLSPNQRKRLLEGNWEYDDNPYALCDYEKIVDIFSNVFVKEGEKYITVDVARKGKDTTRIIFWLGWRMLEMITLERALTQEVVKNVRALQSRYSVPNSNTIADEDGIGGGVVDMLGCKGFIAMSSPILIPAAKNDQTELYYNFKSQCGFYLAKKVNSAEIYSTLEGREKEMLIEELEQLEEMELAADMKARIISKDIMKERIGRSPDILDNCIMRASFDLHKRIERTRFLSAY
jgi:hypothetical protein